MAAAEPSTPPQSPSPSSSADDGSTLAAADLDAHTPDELLQPSQLWTAFRQALEQKVRHVSARCCCSSSYNSFLLLQTSFQHSYHTCLVCLSGLRCRPTNLCSLLQAAPAVRIAYHSNCFASSAQHCHLLHSKTPALRCKAALLPPAAPSSAAPHPPALLSPGAQAARPPSPGCVLQGQHHVPYAGPAVPCADLQLSAPPAGCCMR